MGMLPLMKWMRDAQDEQDGFMLWLARKCLTSDAKGEFAKSALIRYIRQKQSGCSWEIAKHGMCKHGNGGKCDTLGDCKEAKPEKKKVRK